MTTKSMLDEHQVGQFIALLDQGFSFDECLSILNTTTKSSVFEEIQDMLNEGESLESVIASKLGDSTLKETFLCLYPMKGLKEALIDAKDMYLQKKQWTSFLVKQLQYPLFVLMMMLCLSLFVTYFLLPEMSSLYESFGSTVELSTEIYFHLIALLPLMLSFIVVTFILSVTITMYAITWQNEKLLGHLLRFSFLRKWIQIYYSLKFAFYFSKLAMYFDSFYEAMTYFYNAHHVLDLNPILKQMVYELKEGVELSLSIQRCIYFSDEFKQYFSLLVLTKQKFQFLDTYCKLSISTIQDGLKKMTNIFLGLVYITCGLYVMCLYSLMIVPVLEMVTSL